MKRYHTWIAIAWMLTGCFNPGDADDIDLGAETGTTSSASSTDPVTTGSSTTGSSTTGSSTTGSSTMDPSTTGTDSGTTQEGGTTKDTEADEDADGTGTTGGGSVYPACNIAVDPECPRPFDLCVVYPMNAGNHCSFDCVNDGDCPAPESGTAVATCVSPDNRCELGCSNAIECPDGMVCVTYGDLAQTQRCSWLD